MLALFSSLMFFLPAPSPHERVVKCCCLAKGPTHPSPAALLLGLLPCPLSVEDSRNLLQSCRGQRLALSLPGVAGQGYHFQSAHLIGTVPVGEDPGFWLDGLSAFSPPPVLQISVPSSFIQGPLPSLLSALSPHCPSTPPSVERNVSVG